MSVALAEQLRTAKVYDLEQPCTAGMPVHPAHRPGYFYALDAADKRIYVGQQMDVSIRAEE